MRATVAPNIARDTTNGMVISSLSMNNLLFIISTVPGLPQLKRMPQTVGSLINKLCYLFLNCTRSFTLVKAGQGIVIYNTIHICFKYVLPKFPEVWPAFGRVNISGKCPDSAWPTPAETACPAFCRRSEPGITSMEICPVSKLTWRWSVFPVALSCKALPVTSFLLY